MRKRISSRRACFSSCSNAFYPRDGGALPAFATQEGELSTEIKHQIPTLTITFPNTSDIILNPYRMKYEGTVTAGSGIEANDRFQIMNAKFSVESKTLASVKVTATFTGEVGGDAEFSNADVLPGDTGKKVNLKLTYAIGTAAAIPTADDTGSNVVTISDSEQVKEWTLPAATKSGSSITGQFINMQFSGTCSDKPADSPWTSDDTVSCGIAFEAIPVTDIPMIAVTYQSVASGSTANPLTFNTDTPADAKTSGADWKVVSFAYGAAGTAEASLTAVPTGNNTLDAATVWTNGKTVTIAGADIAAPLGTTAVTNTKVIVTLSYTDTNGATQTVKYELKVNVLAPAT